MSQEKKHLQPDIDLDAQALLALSEARATPPGPERSAAMKRAGILRNAADKHGLAFQQPLQVRPVGRSAGVSAIIIARADQSPAGMGLTLYIGGSSVVLRIQRVELLIEPMLGGDPGVDGAADRFDRSWLHDRASPMANESALSLSPKKRGPFHLVPVMAKATLERLS